MSDFCLLTTVCSATGRSLAWRPTGPGGESGVVPPVPIPNTVVKRSSAHDTGVTKPRENRPVPGPVGRHTSTPQRHDASPAARADADIPGRLTPRLTTGGV